MWNSKNGREVAVYLPYESSEYQFITIHCVDFHPYDNIIAISQFGKNFPILVYCFVKNIEKPEVNLIIKENNECESTNFQDVKELKLNDTAKGNLSFNKNEEKLDFKTLLQKMDVILTPQKNE